MNYNLPEYLKDNLRSILAGDGPIKKKKDYEVIPATEEGEDGQLIINVDDCELNSDWIRSARLDPESEESKARENSPMVRGKK